MIKYLSKFFIRRFINLDKLVSYGFVVCKNVI